MTSRGSTGCSSAPCATPTPSSVAGSRRSFSGTTATPPSGSRPLRCAASGQSPAVDAVAGRHSATAARRVRRLAAARRHRGDQRSLRRRHARQRPHDSTARGERYRLPRGTLPHGRHRGRAPRRRLASGDRRLAEGARLVPLRMQRAGRQDRDVRTLLDFNSRLPDLLHGDLAAAAGALDHLRRGDRRRRRARGRVPRHSARGGRGAAGGFAAGQLDDRRPGCATAVAGSMPASRCA